MCQLLGTCWTQVCAACRGSGWEEHPRQLPCLRLATLCGELCKSVSRNHGATHLETSFSGEMSTETIALTSWRVSLTVNLTLGARKGSLSLTAWSARPCF